MSKIIEFTESFITYLEEKEYDCTDESTLEWFDLEVELAHLHDDCPAKYERVCHA